jgi:hypothetical protein
MLPLGSSLGSPLAWRSAFTVPTTMPDAQVTAIAKQPFMGASHIQSRTEWPEAWSGALSLGSGPSVDVLGASVMDDLGPLRCDADAREA